MRSVRPITLTLLAMAALVSCSRDPEVTKKRYLESGDKYFSKNRYKEAGIQYRNALKVDAQYGLAHYKLGLTFLRLDPPEFVSAVKALRRAVERLDVKAVERWAAVVKLTEIYLSPLVTHDEQVMKEVAKNCADLLARDADSFDGHRLTADYQYISATDALKVKRTEDGQKLLDAALEEYRKADALKPADQGVTLQMARTLWLKNDMAGAEQLFRKALDKDEHALQAYREFYTMLWAQNKRKEAEDLLRAGYQRNPKEHRFLIWLAEQHLFEQRRDDMNRDLETLKTKVAEYPRAYLDVGDFYLRVGDGDSAIREFRAGMSKDNKNRASYQKRIVEVLLRQGKRAEAGDANAEVLKENPNDADALGVKATLLLDKGDVTKALMELQQVVTRSPENAVARFNLGRAYVLRGEAEQARQQFQKAIDLHPRSIQARLALAQLQLVRGEFEAALRTAQETLNLDANNTSAKLIESAALMGQRKFSDSRQLLDGMLQANPSSPEVLFQVGVVSLAESKFKEAEDSFWRAYQLNPANARGLMGVVETYMAQNKTDQAIQVLESESVKTPSRSDFHLALGNVAVRTGRWDRALVEFQKVLASADKGSRTQGEMYLRIGETQRRKGDFNASIIALQQARQTLPDDERVLSTLGLALDAANRWPEAKKVYQAVAKLYPANGVVLNNLAFGMAEHGENLDEALSLAQRAKQLIVDLSEVNDTLGWIYLKKNLADNAVQIFTDLVAKHPQQSTFRYHLGMALSQKGDKARARQELKKALEANPGSEERKKIQDLITRLG